MSTFSRNAGFTLVEVLTALVIFAIGMLGIASLQVNGIRHTHTAYQRSQAVLLAQDLTEKMRANPLAMAPADLLYLQDPSTIDPSSVNDCATTSCNSRERAAYDLVEWYTTINTLLRDGNGIACQDSTPGDGSCDNLPGGDILIQISWQEQASRTEGSPDNIRGQGLSLNLGPLPL